MNEKYLDKYIEIEKSALDQLYPEQHRLELQLSLWEVRESCRPPMKDGDGNVMTDAKKKPMRPEPQPETEQTRFDLLVVTEQIRLVQDRYDALVAKRGALEVQAVAAPSLNGQAILATVD